MFWSLVRPDRILPPITRSAAVTTSLGADESAVGIITCERSRRRLLEFDRLIKARISSRVARTEGYATCYSRSSQLGGRVRVPCRSQDEGRTAPVEVLLEKPPNSD